IRATPIKHSCQQDSHNKHEGANVSPDEVHKRDPLLVAISPFGDQEERWDQHDFEECIELDQVSVKNCSQHAQGIEVVECEVQSIPMGWRLVADLMVHVGY